MRLLCTVKFLLEDGANLMEDFNTPLLLGSSTAQDLLNHLHVKPVHIEDITASLRPRQLALLAHRPDILKRLFRAPALAHGNHLKQISW